MKTLEAVRRGIAIDSMFRDYTVIHTSRRTYILQGAAHQTWVAHRRRTWAIPL